MTVSGDKLDYKGDPSSPAISLLNTNIFLNSVISDVRTGAKFCTVDVKNHYLQSPIKNFQYMLIPPKHFTEDIRNEYDIIDIKENSYVYTKILKVMYGLKEA